MIRRSLDRFLAAVWPAYRKARQRSRDRLKLTADLACATYLLRTDRSEPPPDFLVPHLRRNGIAFPTPPEPDRAD
ncbi:hypothetical protein [Alienimonas sp. DA493]|uniref:hypothetical protein n=1 Tax=Alienimonas sp. DA493 TaxID=3373605 RepID=UPI0037545D13